MIKGKQMLKSKALIAGMWSRESKPVEMKAREAEIKSNSCRVDWIPGEEIFTQMKVTQSDKNSASQKISVLLYDVWFESIVVLKL
jgi:hypothetical protein